MKFTLRRREQGRSQRVINPETDKPFLFENRADAQREAHQLNESYHPERRPHDRETTIAAVGKSFCHITCPFCGTRCRAFIWSLAGGGKRCPKCKAKHQSDGTTVNDQTGPVEIIDDA